MTGSSRTAIRILLLAAGAGLGCGPAELGAESAILISLDTLRADHVGLYGYARDTSPNLDRFAREAFVFERALASSPNTAPSHASLMTSLYPGRHAFTGTDDRIPAEHETLASLLRRAGRRTAAFTDGVYVRGELGFDRGFELYDDAGTGLAETLPRARRWLEANGAEPFFLFLHTYDVHAPYDPPPPYRDLFHERPYAGDVEPTGPALNRIWLEDVELGAEDLRHIEARYDEGIRWTDAQLGDFLRWLDERGFLERAVVIVTSDHGEEFGEHGSVLHWQLYYEPNLHVPLVVRPPGGVDGPVRIPGSVQLIDLLPTLLELLGAPPHPAAQGVSLVGSMLRRRADERPAFAWWADPHELPLRSIVHGDRQLVFDETRPGFGELYDVAADPRAQRDLAAGEPGAVRSLRALAMPVMQANRTPPLAPRSRNPELERKIVERLEQLGYGRGAPPADE
jgi:arylsulfatase